MPSSHSRKRKSAAKTPVLREEDGGDITHDSVTQETVNTEMSIPEPEYDDGDDRESEADNTNLSRISDTQFFTSPKPQDEGEEEEEELTSISTLATELENPAFQIHGSTMYTSASPRARAHATPSESVPFDPPPPPPLLSTIASHSNDTSNVDSLGDDDFSLSTLTQTANARTAADVTERIAEEVPFEKKDDTREDLTAATPAKEHADGEREDTGDDMYEGGGAYRKQRYTPPSPAPSILKSPAFRPDINGDEATAPAVSPRHFSPRTPPDERIRQNRSPSGSPAPALTPTPPLSSSPAAAPTTTRPHDHLMQSPPPSMRSPHGYSGTPFDPVAQQQQQQQQRQPTPPSPSFGREPSPPFHDPMVGVHANIVPPQTLASPPTHSLGNGMRGPPSPTAYYQQQQYGGSYQPVPQQQQHVYYAQDAATGQVYAYPVEPQPHNVQAPYYATHPSPPPQQQQQSVSKHERKASASSVARSSATSFDYQKIFRRTPRPSASNHLIPPMRRPSAAAQESQHVSTASRSAHQQQPQHHQPQQFQQPQYQIPNDCVLVWNQEMGTYMMMRKSAVMMNAVSLPPQQQQVQPQQPEMYADSPYPMTEDGRPDFDRFTPEHAREFREEMRFTRRKILRVFKDVEFDFIQDTDEPRAIQARYDRVVYDLNEKRDSDFWFKVLKWSYAAIDAVFVYAGLEPTMIDVFILERDMLVESCVLLGGQYGSPTTANVSPITKLLGWTAVYLVIVLLVQAFARKLNLGTKMQTKIRNGFLGAVNLANESLKPLDHKAILNGEAGVSNALMSAGSELVGNLLKGDTSGLKGLMSLIGGGDDDEDDEAEEEKVAAAPEPKREKKKGKGGGNMLLGILDQLKGLDLGQFVQGLVGENADDAKEPELATSGVATNYR